MINTVFIYYKLTTPKFYILPTSSKKSLIIIKVIFDFIISYMFKKNVLYKLKALTQKLEVNLLNIIEASNVTSRFA